MPTVKEIADLLGAVLEGDPAVEIRGVAGLADAGPGELSFLSNPKYAHEVSRTRASAVLVPPAWKGECGCALIRVANPDAEFARVVSRLGPPPVPRLRGIHPTAVVAGDAVLAADVGVGPWVVIEPGARVGAGTELCAGVYVGHESVIGEGCTLYPHVTVRERVRIGNRVIIHSGAVIGSDGFGYVPRAGRWEKIPQIGTVEIGDDVEIGANVTVDRARFGRTVIEEGAKIDNLVQIAHNVRVGAHSALAAQVGLAGSTRLGHHVQMGGQSGATGHMVIGDHAVVAARGAVTKDVPPAVFVSGFPAMPHEKFKELHAHTARLPQLKEKVIALEKRVAELEARLRGEGKGIS